MNKKERQAEADRLIAEYNRAVLVGDRDRANEVLGRLIEVKANL